MQRQLYPALLLITTALAAALYLRPTVGEELMALAGARGNGTTASFGQVGSGGALGYTSQATVFPQGFPAASSQRAPAAQSSWWPGAEAGEAFAGNVPADSASLSPSYPQAGAREEWPTSRFEYSRQPQAPLGTETTPPQYGAGRWPNPQSGSEAARSPLGPSPYPIAGSAGNDPQPVATPDSYPTAGGAAQAWGEFDPLGRYPTAGSPAVQPGYAPSVAGQDYHPHVAQPNYGPRAAQAEYGPNAGRSVAPTGYGPPPGRPNEGVSVTSPMPRPAQAGPAGPVIPESRRCEGARVLAWVGDDVILESEVMPAYEEIMRRIPESQLASRPPDRVEVEKKALIAKILEERIQTKLLCQEAKRTIPEEGLPDIKRKIGKYFEEEELPRRIEKAGVASRRELDEKLRAIGSSVDRMKRAFIEQSLAAEWLRQQKGPEPKISHEQMFDYYSDHVADFETPARAHWERLSVRKPRYGDPQEARARLAQMGNQVIRGMSMADVLKGQPRGDVQCEGGVQGWVTQGNLDVSKGLEEAIFGLPVGKPSRIFEEGDCLHIVRVLEREEFKRTPFEDAEVQKQIREKLQDDRRQEQVEEYLAKLKKEIPVRTVFDDDPELAELRRQMAASRE